MKRLTLLLILSAALLCAGTASATSDVVCGQECRDWLGGDYSIQWADDDIVWAGDNASSICANHGGLLEVSYEPGQGYHGEAILIAIVVCMDGTEHRIGIARSMQGGATDGGDGNPNHTYEEGPPPADPYEDQGGTVYTQCPGTDDPAYDPNNEACW